MIENRMVVDDEWNDKPDYSNNSCCEVCGERIGQEDAVYIPRYGYVCDSCLKDSRKKVESERL